MKDKLTLDDVIKLVKDAELFNVWHWENCIAGLIAKHCGFVYSHHSLFEDKNGEIVGGAAEIADIVCDLPLDAYYPARWPDEFKERLYQSNGDWRIDQITAIDYLESLREHQNE